MKRSGFTLIEMLVALSIFALIGAGGALLLRQTLIARDAASARLTELSKFQRVRSYLVNDLAQAARRITRDPTGVPARDSFTGNVGPVLLGITRRGWENPDADPRASLQYVEYRLVNNRLERRYRRYLDGAQFSDPQVLLSDVENLDISFLLGDQWIPHWENARADRLPRAVRLRMRLKGLGEMEQWFLVAEGEE